MKLYRIQAKKSRDFPHIVVNIFSGVNEKFFRVTNKSKDKSWKKCKGKEIVKEIKIIN